MEQHRFRVSVSTPKHRAFAYELPVMSTTAWGEQDASVPQLEYKTFVDVMVRTRTEDDEKYRFVHRWLQVWLMPNRYTHAKFPAQVGWVKSSYRPHVDDWIVAPKAIASIRDMV